MGDPAFRRAAHLARFFPSSGENDEDIVAKQVQELDEAGIFRLVTSNDVDGTLAHLAHAEADLALRDIVGATPLLIAFLYQHFALGRAILEAFPVAKGYPYGLMQYADRGAAVSPYRGENILHIAIVHRNVPVVRWLVDTMPDLLDAETTGSFFAPGTPCYFGGTPLLFALASNLLDAASAILNAAAVAPKDSAAAKTTIWMTDAIGNNALHLAVVHDLPEVYDFAVKHAMARFEYACPRGFDPTAPGYDLPAFLKQLYGADKATFQRFLRQLNHDQLSPLTLAAAMGKAAMLQHVLGRQTTTAWMYGPVTAKMIPLRELEEPLPLAGGRPKTAIECLCSYLRLSSCIPPASDVLRARLDLLGAFEVKTLIDKKWTFNGASAFYWACCRHVVFALVLTASTLLPGAGNQRRSGLALLAELYVVVETAAKVARERREVRHHGVRAYWHDTGAAMVDTVLKLTQVAAVAGAVGCRAARRPVAEDGCVAAALLGAYLHLLFFLYGFRRTGPFIVMLHRMLFSDVVRFSLVYAAVLGGFGTSLYVVVDGRGGAHMLGDRLKALLLAAFAATFNFDDYRLGRMPVPAQLGIFAYMVLVVIVLINLLIAMMGNTYDSIIDGAEQRWYAERVNIMSSLATGRPPAQEASDRLKYAVELGHGDAKERFLQVELVEVDRWRVPPSPLPSVLPSDVRAPVPARIDAATQTPRAPRRHNVGTNTPGRSYHDDKEDRRRGAAPPLPTAKAVDPNTIFSQALRRRLHHVAHAGRVGSVHVTTRDNDDDIVAKQVRDMSEGIFKLVGDNNKDGALAFLRKAPADLGRRDIVGATPVLFAFLTTHFELGQALIEAYPELATSKYALLTYEDRGTNVSPYRGENVLHIAIVHRNVAMVEWLVSTIPDLLDAETTGSFFAPGTPCYLGGTPFLFALSSKLLGAAKVMLAAAKKAPKGSGAAKTTILMADTYGNNALHLAVVHDLPEVYDFAVKHAMAEFAYACPPNFSVDDDQYDLPGFLKTLVGVDKIAFRSFLGKYNDDLLTPLTLAAAMGNASMFQHILHRQTTVAWVYGPVTAKMLPLRGFEERQYIFDTKPTAAVLPIDVLRASVVTRNAIDGQRPRPVDGQARSGKTAIECLCSYLPLTNCIPDNIAAHEAVRRARLKLISTFEVKTLLDKKWKFVGSKMFLRALVRHVVFTIVFTSSTFFTKHYRDGGPMEAEDWVLVALECYVLLETFLRLQTELREIWLHGIRSYAEDSGAAMVDNMIKFVLVALVVAATICRAKGSFFVEDGFVGAALLCTHSYNFFFLYGFRTTGPFIVMIRRMLLTDVFRFVLVYGSILLGFGSALYVVVDARTGATAYLARLKLLLLAAFAATFTFDEYAASRMSVLAQLLIFVYLVLVIIVLVNLLIAMMGNTYDSIIDGAEQRWYAERANIMGSMSNGRSRQQREADRLKYAVELDVGSEKERFLQVEFVHVEAWHDAKDAEKSPDEIQDRDLSSATNIVHESQDEENENEEPAVESSVSAIDAALTQLSNALVEHFTSEIGISYDGPSGRETLALAHVEKIRDLIAARCGPE
ncbi:vanilloid receptor-related osmotically activated cha (ISS) [Achlya hypogyna]|uniref:Vanilloid receptor-related osmotically activated cha (ISS) n=1 Tax=Achlya hypogyna TaxID=1202772 RepID=A0A1V9ZKN1_ACHHY|nr:vanilloid receptor-related osmotically activated cha (ISS) [Achlya hypogyna]